MQLSRWFAKTSEYSEPERQNVRRRGKLFFVFFRGSLGNAWLIAILAVGELSYPGRFTPFFGFMVSVILFAGYLFAFSDWDELENRFVAAIDEQSKLERSS